MGKYEMYEDAANEWRWRYRSSNGNIIGMSSEGYTTKGACERSIEIMQESADAPVVVVDG